MSREVHVRFCESPRVKFPRATHLVVMAHNQSPKLIAFIESKLEGWMGLKLNREKTRIVKLTERGTSLDFLGYTFRQARNWRTGNRVYWEAAPSRKALGREREKLRQMTGTGEGYKPVPVLIAEMNRHLRGWSNYFSFGYPKGAYREINWYVQTRLYLHLRRRSQRPYRVPEVSTLYQHLRKMGLVYL